MWELRGYRVSNATSGLDIQAAAGPQAAISSGSPYFSTKRSNKESAMYTNILIPTDGSELADKAVQHGIALAQRIFAKVCALTVLPPFHVFTTDPQMIEDTPAQYKARM